MFHAPSSLAAIRSVDEAVVIGVALSLSSSAFVLQLLNERGELPTKFGSATLGILLAQVRGVRGNAIDGRLWPIWLCITYSVINGRGI